MSPFIVLALFGFIQVGLEASIIKRDYCVNDDEEAVKLLGFNCTTIAWDDSLPDELCDRDDVKAICPETCDGICYRPGVGMEDYDYGSYGGDGGPVQSHGAPASEYIPTDPPTCVCDDKVCRGSGCTAW